MFRDHKQENKRKEMFHHCYMFAIILHSSSTSWELRNSVLPMLFQSGNVKDISTSTSTIQGCFFLLTRLQFKHVNCTSSFTRELRNSVLPMLFQFGNVKDISISTSTIQGCFCLLTGLQFKHVNCTSSSHSGAEKFCTTHAFSI